MKHHISIYKICQLQKNRIILWKKHGIFLNCNDLFRIIEENHMFNYLLWQLENKIRQNNKDLVYNMKKKIDYYNYNRNDRTEAIDKFLFRLLKPINHKDFFIYPDTPGMIIDRLSILSLKISYIYNRLKEKSFEDCYLYHYKKNLLLINEQKNYLIKCFNKLINVIYLTKKTFKIFYNFKFYENI